MDALRIFSPGAQRQDSEYGKWKDLGYNNTIEPSASQPTQAVELPSVHEQVIVSAGHALVSHSAMIERLTRSS